MRESKTSVFSDENIENEYPTTDLRVAAYLSFKGFAYEFDRRNPRQIIIIFRGDAILLKSLVRKFWDNEDGFRSYAHHLTEMKKGIFSDNYISRDRVLMDSVQKNEGERVAKSVQLALLI